jgi:hypothetical protein
MMFEAIRLVGGKAVVVCPSKDLVVQTFCFFRTHFNKRISISAICSAKIPMDKIKGFAQELDEDDAIRDEKVKGGEVQKRAKGRGRGERKRYFPQDWTSDIVVVTTDSMRNISLEDFEACGFKIAIVDEAHHVPAITITQVSNILASCKYTMALSASPNDRSDGLWYIIYWMLGPLVAFHFPTHPQVLTDAYIVKSTYDYGAVYKPKSTNIDMSRTWEEEALCETRNVILADILFRSIVESRRILSKNIVSKSASTSTSAPAGAASTSTSCLECTGEAEVDVHVDIEGTPFPAYIFMTFCRRTCQIRIIAELLRQMHVVYAARTGTNYAPPKILEFTKTRMRKLLLISNKLHMTLY